MKINILCKSPLLQKTLDSYLKEYITNYDECDFIIFDEIDENFNKPICLINFNEDSDIRRPIYKESLLSDLEKFNKQVEEISRININKFNTILDTNELESLKKSLDSINIESKNKDEIRSEIENIVQDFTNRLYEVLSKSV
ncbi:MAG: hypothetical protein K2P17_00595 [Helicobacteraceae bacterium]|nr:hypothetical protein [Helicobacteraceae bacterium]